MPFMTSWATSPPPATIMTRPCCKRPALPSVLSNYGLSYLLEGDLTSAEGYLREAAKQPGADSRVRQNLALVLGLQGKFAEAEAIASNELSPQQAAANMAYLKAMLKERGNWKNLKKQG